MPVNLNGNRRRVKCHLVQESLNVRLESLMKRIYVDSILDSNPAALTPLLNFICVAY